MAPEQAAGDAKRVTTAADVYSLGAILYELLAGRPPFTGGSALEVLRKVREEEPLPPSRITDHELRTTNDRTSERANRKPRIVNAVDRDLEVICLKCLNKEPAKRYASAEALAEELDRWLAGEPIHARPITAAEVFTRWCRRRPALATAFAALVLVLVAGVTGVTRQWRRAEEHSRRWQLERYAADLQVASQALAGHDLGLARRLGSVAGRFDLLELRL